MRKKILNKDQILRAMKYTKSNMAAARFLGCSYPHYKQYAKLYKNEDGKTLFEIHLNRQGKGISKHLYKKKDITPIMDILEGRVDVSNYSPKELKERLIHEALIKEECNCCEFNERRVLDYKVPLILNFKDGNKKNWKLENLEALCYNCYFLMNNLPFVVVDFHSIRYLYLKSNNYNITLLNFLASNFSYYHL